MGDWEALTHKALLPLGEKAVLSLILSTFPNLSSIVVVLGHRGELIREYLSLAHPNLPVSYVTVDRFDGQGAGPGHSLWCARHLLQEPFVFTACDTIVSELPQDLQGNWMGVVEVDDVREWCSAVVNERGEVRDIAYKTDAPTNLAFVGLAGVSDYSNFWDALSPRTEEVAERQVDDGLRALIPSGLFVRSVNWIDTGNASNYAQAVENFGALNFKGKTNELTYRIDDRVLKYLPQPAITAKLAERAKFHRGVFAEVLGVTPHFLACTFYRAPVLASVIAGSLVTDFLTWAQTLLWRDMEVDPGERERIAVEFYIEKTRQRLSRYLETFGPEADVLIINGVSCLSIERLLVELESHLKNHIWPSTFHGDLHGENILCTGEGFRLIDWRDSFGSQILWGDRYYDLAKFFHTIDLSVDAMRCGNYDLQESSNGVTIRHEQLPPAAEAATAFWHFVESKGYNRQMILLLNGLVFVNMAPLYEPKMARYLYTLGRYRLQRARWGEL